MCIWQTVTVRLPSKKPDHFLLYYERLLNVAQIETRLAPSVFAESVLKILTSSGLMSYMNPQHIFVTVHDAVLYIQQQKVSVRPQMLTLQSARLA